MIQVKNKQDCCGCGACVQRCPNYCIVFHEDSEGFLYPQVDISECMDCGLCEKVCPMLHHGENRVLIQIYAAKNIDDSVRLKSSSGGIFALLADEIVEEGGVVFGACFDEKWEVCHRSAETKEGVLAFRGSKYIQSRIENTFAEAELFLKQGRQVLFSGSPCQIGGLKNFLHKSYDNLLTVDFVCHGVPSVGVWREYLHSVLSESARRAATGKNTVLSSSLNTLPVVTGIEFRDKTLHGWKKFSFVVRGKSAHKGGQNSVLLSGIYKENLFMQGFLSNTYLRPSCYDCKHKNFKSGSDITLADYWGIQDVHPDFDDDKGVSLLFVNSPVGQMYFDKIKNRCHCMNSTMEEAMQANPSIKKAARKRSNRARFYADSRQNVEERIRRYSRYTLYEKCRLRIIQLLMLMGILSIIKKLLRK